MKHLPAHNCPWPSKYANQFKQKRIKHWLQWLLWNLVIFKGGGVYFHIIWSEPLPIILYKACFIYLSDPSRPRWIWGFDIFGCCPWNHLQILKNLFFLRSQHHMCLSYIRHFINICWKNEIYPKHNFILISSTHRKLISILCEDL